MSGRLNGKIALVTGAGRGIGRAVAVAYAREGATLALCSRTKDELEAAAAEAQKSGGKVFARTVDLSIREAVRGFVEETVKRYSRVDVLVNNAGALGPRMPLEEVSESEWETTLRVNLTSVFWLTGDVLRRGMRERGGVVINVSSGAGRRGKANWGPYAVSKYGMEGLTSVWADEYRERGVRFYSLNPSPTRTRMRAEACPEEDPETLKSPEEAAKAFIELVSDECTIPTGTAAWLDRGDGKLQY